MPPAAAVATAIGSALRWPVVYPSTMRDHGRAAQPLLTGRSPALADRDGVPSCVIAAKRDRRADLPSSAIHKSVGLTILTLALGRSWRRQSRHPLAGSHATLEKLLAREPIVMFDVCIIDMTWRVGGLYAGWPRYPWLGVRMAVLPRGGATGRATDGTARTRGQGLYVDHLHVAALKHHFIDRTNVAPDAPWISQGQ